MVGFFCFNNSHRLNFRDLERNLLDLPQIESAFGNGGFSADISAAFLLVQNRNNLRFCISGLIHMQFKTKGFFFNSKLSVILGHLQVDK
jgi:hypothetical protein